MKPKYLDIHAHINFDDYDQDRGEVIKRSFENDVAFINVGTNKETSKESIELVEKYKSLSAIVGLHPIYVDFLGREGEEFDYNFYLNLAKNQKVVGIGECGLDFFHVDNSDQEAKERQKTAFKQQLKLALEVDKPVMIHCRNAYTEVIKILEQVQEESGGRLKGNFHFFSGTKEDMKKILDLGFYVSFTGVITFTSQYHEIVRDFPLDKMNIETDSPYVAPLSYRGKRNEPSYVIEVAQKIAEVKGLQIEEVRDQFLKNAEKLFGLKF